MEEISSIKEELQLPEVDSLNQGSTENPLMESEQNIVREGYAGPGTYLTNFEGTEEIPGVPEQTTSLREYSGGYADSTPKESIRNVISNVNRATNEEGLSDRSGQVMPGRKEVGFMEGPNGERTYIYSKPRESQNINPNQQPTKGLEGLDPDGERAKFMELAIKQIGFNPFLYNPNEEANKDLEANYNSIVSHVFGNGVNSRSLTKEQSEFLQRQLKMYHDMKLGVYQKKGELGKAYLDHMLTNFDKDLPTIHGKYVVSKKGKVISTLPTEDESQRKAESEELTMRKKIEDLVAKDLKNRFQGKVQYDSITGEWKTEPGTDPNMVRKSYTDMKKKYYDRYRIKYSPDEFEIPDNPETHVKGEPRNTGDAVKWLDSAKTESEARERAARLAKAGWKKEHLKLAIGRSKWR